MERLEKDDDGEKKKKEEEEEEEEDKMKKQKYAEDGSVDLKGNPVLTCKTGGWTACYFIIVYEAFERMAYHGISSNLVIYLTRVLHQGTVDSANNVTNWMGTGFLTPIFGAFIADAYLGRFWTFVCSSLLYFLGMCVLTLAVSLPSLRPPPCDATGCKPASSFQLGIFFTGLYLLAFANGGTKPNISTMGADQFDEFDPKERAQKASFFNWWMFSTFFGTIFATIVLIYIQDNVGWSLGYGLPTVGFLISVVIFLVGTPFYRHKLPQGSPLTKMARVLVAALRKWNVPLPDNPSELHELDHREFLKNDGKFRILSTDSLRFLNKAAVKVGTTTDPWMLCSVTEVEETKQMLWLLPVWVSLLVSGVLDAQIGTLFVKQGTTLDRHIGHHFQIPPASIVTFGLITLLISLLVYDRYFVKIARSWTGDRRGITILQRIGCGLVIQSAAILVASVIDHRRLVTARAHGLVESGGQIPLTVFILLPQFMLMGLADCFVVPGKMEFFYSQAPESMKSMGASYSLATYGVGNFISSVLLTSVSDITKRGGHRGWITNNLNKCRLDYYYALLASLAFLNFIGFVLVSKKFVYRVEVFESTHFMLEMEDHAEDKLKQGDA